MNYNFSDYLYIENDKWFFRDELKRGGEVE